MCGYFQPEVEFHDDADSGAATAVTVRGAWPNPDPNLHVEVAQAPNANRELRLDVFGAVGGILIIGHYERTAALPQLPPGAYSLEVYLQFNEGGTVVEHYCGGYSLLGAYPVPTVGSLGAALLALLVVLVGLVALRVRTHPPVPVP